jgi:hypothetical protein
MVLGTLLKLSKPFEGMKSTLITDRRTLFYCCLVDARVQNVIKFIIPGVSNLHRPSAPLSKDPLHSLSMWAWIFGVSEGKSHLQCLGLIIYKRLA